MVCLLALQVTLVRRNCDALASSERQGDNVAELRLGSSRSASVPELVVTGALLVVTRKLLETIANIVTTSKAPVTTSDAPVCASVVLCMSNREFHREKKGVHMSGT